jgi:hypothetical protein
MRLRGGARGRARRRRPGRGGGRRGAEARRAAALEARAARLMMRFVRSVWDAECAAFVHT